MSEGRGLDTSARAAVPAARGGKIKPLALLVPTSRYRFRALAALVALMVAALATLAVPVAVRRDDRFRLFRRQTSALIDNYFAVMIAVVGVLAVACGVRFYLVT